MSQLAQTSAMRDSLQLFLVIHVVVFMEKVAIHPENRRRVFSLGLVDEPQREGDVVPVVHANML
jgi:hypothetical protein